MSTLLVTTAYNDPYPGVKNRKDWRFFYERWRTECAQNFEKNFTATDTNIKHSYTLLKPYKLIKQGEYVLPLLGYIDLKTLKGDKLFFPCSFRSDLPLPRTIYKADRWGEFPKRYKATLIGHTKDGMQWSHESCIYLHGFVSPAKWHYGVWKHMGYNLLNNTPFERCRVNDDNDSCDEPYCVKNSLFSKVHNHIAEDCKNYLNKMVTFFNNNATNKIAIYNVPDRNYYKEIIMEFNMEINRRRWVSLLYGKCFNFNWAESTPVFHLTPVTVYPRKKPFCNHDSKNWKLIFEGELKDIRVW